MRTTYVIAASSLLAACISPPPSRPATASDTGIDMTGRDVEDDALVPDGADPDPDADERDASEMGNQPLIRLRIPAASVGGDISGFVALVNGRHDALQSGVGRADLQFMAADQTTVLPHEVEYFDSSTGTLRAWVRLPTVFAAQDTDFFIDLSGRVGTQAGTPWDGGWVGVWHMEEDDPTDGATIADSSPEGNDGTCVDLRGPPVAGQIGRGISFDGVDDYVLIPNADSLEPPNSVTVSAWVSDPTADSGGIISKPAISIGQDFNNSYQLWINSERLTTHVVAANDAVNTATGTVVPDSGWHFLVATYDGSAMRVYRDGELEREMALSGAIQYDDVEPDLYIGVDRNDTRYALHLEALIDEARVGRFGVGTTRVRAWYDNQVDPASFVIWDP